MVPHDENYRGEVIFNRHYATYFVKWFKEDPILLKKVFFEFSLNEQPFQVYFIAGKNNYEISQNKSFLGI